jgi:hypothetical protein
MSAEVLCEASALIRKGMPYEHMAGHIDDRDLNTWLAVADWLDEQANRYEADENLWRVTSLDPECRWAERGLTVEANLEHHYARALTVARTYAGATA